MLQVIPAGSLLTLSPSAFKQFAAAHPGCVSLDAPKIGARLKGGLTTALPAAAPAAATAVSAAAASGKPLVHIGVDAGRFTVQPDIVLSEDADYVLVSPTDVSAAGDVVVVGDVHNCHRTVRSLLATLEQDGSRPFVVFAGDLIGKGGASLDDAFAMLDLYIELERTGRAVSTLGNWEFRLLELLRGLAKAQSTELDEDEVDTSSPLGDLALAIDAHERRREYVKTLSSMPLAIDVGHRTAVAHAGYSSRLLAAVGRDNRQRAVNVFCYGRRADSFGRTDSFDGTLVVGHSTVETPRARLRHGAVQVRIDTGCGLAAGGGSLTAFKVGSVFETPSSPDAETLLSASNVVSVRCHDADRRRH